MESEPGNAYHHGHRPPSFCQINDEGANAISLHSSVEGYEAQAPDAQSTASAMATPKPKSIEDCVKVRCIVAGLLVSNCASKPLSWIHVVPNIMRGILRPASRWGRNRG